ncbi:MAG: SCP2 sterol-binding domain-containing protein [Desulfatibacillum sp.]|nr:SCP2 sterol-binding domain-containing protein [Desulfatibacillum sp.]
MLLRVMAAQMRFRPSLRKMLRGKDGWIDFSVGISTEAGSVAQSIRFHEGRIRVRGDIPQSTDTVLIFEDDQALRKMLFAPPAEIMNLMLKNKLKVEGNLTYAQAFNFFVSLLMGKRQVKELEKARQEDLAARKNRFGGAKRADKGFLELAGRKNGMTSAPGIDPGVRFLDEPYFSSMGLEDFPRLNSLLDAHFNDKPRVCCERPRLLTRFFRENGFQDHAEHRAVHHARAFHYLLSQKSPLIAANDLLAGTTTSMAPTGVLIFPDAQGSLLWGELKTVEHRLLNPYRISKETSEILHSEIFPFWARRNFWEWVRTKHRDPLCQKINNRWVAYFVWKTVGVSHTIPDFERLLAKGSLGIIEDAKIRLEDSGLSREERESLDSMIICLEAVNIYAGNLANQARDLAALEDDPQRKQELIHMETLCRRVPAHPAQNLDEAVQSIWTMWIALHNENTNTGFSIGRLDQLLQPYFEKDMESLNTPDERRAYAKRAIELTGCFMLRCADHLPLVPDIGNYLFGGSPSVQAITIGGTKRDGSDGVCDMTYVILKATEMLGLRDPNVNARFCPGVNSHIYLKRLCQVNHITAATPSLHNDAAVFASLKPHGYPMEDIRDWSATGCVEPTLSGKHTGHTGSILMNLVAPLEMALHNGRHPLMRWDVGPKTGLVEEGDFASFEDFFQAYKTQLAFIIMQAVELNHMLAEAHAQYRPAPLLSAMTQGCIDKASDVTAGGALYNTSGTSNIGLADVVDSLLVIKKLVFDEQTVAFPELKAAIDCNFENAPRLLALVQNKAPRFGSGDAEALDMANRVAGVIHDLWAGHTNFRGGGYTTGFWSMSQHVAYGNLSGALPSGRLKGKAFTPGLTPSPMASPNFLDNIRDVAHLNPEYMDNNIAFNVKLVPSGSESPEKTVDSMAAYATTYFEQGGMQMQFNVVDSRTLEDAMVHPENYKRLLVRISGYNAYFVTLNTEMQLELIERAQYGC